MKRALLILITALLLIAAAACSDDRIATPPPADGTEATPEPNGSEREIPVVSSEPPPPTPEPMPEDFDFPVSDVPELYPDILGVRDAEYGDMPTFATINEASIYVLHNLLNNRFEMEFLLAKEHAPDEGSGFSALASAFENAQAYFPFGEFQAWDMYTEDRGDPDWVFARIKYIYTGEEYDLEARAEAIEFVMKNPVPYGGFIDYESERAYALRIHDFIARKITYSPIGYNIMAALSSSNYEMLQEAYNVLAEDEAVCAGYARAFALICHYAGINAAYVRGNENEAESHAWNIVFPRDGSSPVLVDVTWNDTESDDRVGQEYVSDGWFYVPLDEVYTHTPMEYIDEFLRFVAEGR